MFDIEMLKSTYFLSERSGSWEIQSVVHWKQVYTLYMRAKHNIWIIDTLISDSILSIPSQNYGIQRFLKKANVMKINSSEWSTVGLFIRVIKEGALYISPIVNNFHT